MGRLGAGAGPRATRYDAFGDRPQTRGVISPHSGCLTDALGRIQGKGHITSAGRASQHAGVGRLALFQIAKQNLGLPKFDSGYNVQYYSVRSFPLYNATLILAGLSGGAIGAAGGGAVSFFAASSMSCDFEAVAIFMVGAVGGAIGLLVGGATGFFASFAGRSSGSIICMAGIQTSLIAAVAADDTLLRVSMTVPSNGGITHHQCIFAVFTGAAVGASILVLLAVFFTNRLLAGKLGPSRVLSFRFLLISYLIVGTMTLAISLAGVTAGWWKE